MEPTSSRLIRWLLLSTVVTLLLFGAALVQRVRQEAMHHQPALLEEILK